MHGTETRTLLRETGETRVAVTMTRHSGGTPPTIAVATGLAFLDHMMTVLARYASLDLVLNATGDQGHHLIEDVAITMGLAFAESLPPTAARYGHRTIPMDDALVEAALDAGGRPYYRGPLPSSLYDHWMRSFADNARVTLHVRVLRGRDRHHIVEAAFKALGLAVRDAMMEGESVFSTKGAVAVAREMGGGGDGRAVDGHGLVSD